MEYYLVASMVSLMGQELELLVAQELGLVPLVALVVLVLC